MAPADSAVQGRRVLGDISNLQGHPCPGRHGGPVPVTEEKRRGAGLAAKMWSVFDDAAQSCAISAPVFKDDFVGGSSFPGPCIAEFLSESQNQERHCGDELMDFSADAPDGFGSPSEFASALSVSIDDMPKPSGGDAHFEITVDKSSGLLLGIDVEMSDAETLLIERVNDGLIEEWNRRCPHLLVDAGDRIVQVNGVRNNVWLIVEELKRNQPLDIKIWRPALPTQVCAVGSQLQWQASQGLKLRFAAERLGPPPNPNGDCSTPRGTDSTSSQEQRESFQQFSPISLPSIHLDIDLDSDEDASRGI